MTLASRESAEGAVALMERVSALLRNPTPALNELIEDDALSFALMTILISDDTGQPDTMLSPLLIQKRIGTIKALMLVATEG